MNTLSKRLMLTILVCAAVIVALLKITVLDSPNIMCMVAEGFDEPSTLYYASIERIYKISEKKKVAEKFIEHLTEGENQHLQNCYIRVLGVIGERDAISCLMDAYAKYQHNKNFKSTIYGIVNSLGLIGSEDVLPLLETLLIKYDEHHVQVPSSLIAHSLYLITGKSYYFTSCTGVKERLYLSKERIEARKIIEASRGRRRSFEEMVTLDKLIYRPSEYR
jgi:hypothetical protein